MGELWDPNTGPLCNLGVSWHFCLSAHVKRSQDSQSQRTESPLSLAGPEKAFDGVQDIQPENTAPWHSEDFKLKESEKMVEAHTLTLLLPFCPENRTENPPVRGVHPLPRKERPYLQR